MAENMTKTIQLKPLSQLLGSGESQSQQNETDAVLDIPLSELHPHPENPRTVVHDKEMDELIELIQTFGLQEPIIARRLESGDLQVVSGHRRLFALNHLKMPTAKVFIRDLDDADAKASVALGNKRANLKPTEQAKAYEMLHDAYKQKRGRPLKLVHGELNLHTPDTAQQKAPESPAPSKVTSGKSAPGKAAPGKSPAKGQPPATQKAPEKKQSARQQAADKMGISETEAHRLSKVKDLIPEFQKMLDNKGLQLEQASQIAMMKPEQQKTAYDFMVKEDIKNPSKAQIKNLRFAADEQALSENNLHKVFESKLEKPTERKVIFDNRELNVFPKDMTPLDIKRFMYNAAVKELQAQKGKSVTGKSEPEKQGR